MRKAVSRLLQAVGVVALLAGPGPRATAAQGEPYTIAVLPGAPPVTMHKRWAPFVEELTRRTGLAFRLKFFEGMAEFERDIWGGEPDFIFASPIQTVVAHQSNGFLPLVRSSRSISIGLFVRKDSTVQTLDDLAGKRISFVGNKNLCSVFIQHLLSQHKTRLSYDKEYLGSTRNVVLHVVLGKTDAGAVFIPELENESEDARAKVRAIVTTPAIAPHPLSAHPRVPAPDREAVAKATLAIGATPEGAELLKTLRLEAPVPADYGRDYQALEAIDIKGFTSWGQ